MTTLELSDEEEAALIRLLEQTVEDARFSYAPRLAPLKTIIEKLMPPRPRPPLPASAAPHPGRRRK